MALQHFRSSTANKRPNPASMADGQIALNTAAASPGLFYKDSAGNLVKAGPVHVGTTAPNVSPASGGTAGNSTGEAWLDTSGSNPLLKIWNGSSWQTVQPVASGTVVSTADTGSVTSTMIANGTIVNADVNASAAIAGTKISPDFGSQNVTTTGTSTAASFIPTSSTVPTNGVYLPAANSVALSTNSTGRLFINSSGNIGIGVSSPGDRLHVVGPTAGISARFSDGVNGTLAISHPSSGTSKIADYGGNYGFELAGSSVNFLTAGSERMRLDSSGRLGIGSSSPGYPLTVKTTTDGGQAILDLDNQDAGNYGGLRVHLGKTDRECRLEATYTSSFFSFYTDSAERMRVTSTGVGIGSNAPTKSLEVAAGNTSGNGILVTGSNSPRILLTETDGNVTNWIAVDASAAYAGTISNHPYNIYTNSLERCRVDTSGRLLIGTSSSGMSGGVVQQNGMLGIIANTATSVATSGTLDITINSGGGCFTGFLIVENTLASNAASRTQTLYAVMGRGTSATFTSLASANGSTSGAAFTLSCPSNGVIRVTNNHGGATNINLCWYGPTGY